MGCEEPKEHLTFEGILRRIEEEHAKALGQDYSRVESWKLVAWRYRRRAQSYQLATVLLAAAFATYILIDWSLR